MPDWLDQCVEQLKTKPGVDEPYAISQWMQKQGYKLTASVPELDSMVRRYGTYLKHRVNVADCFKEGDDVTVRVLEVDRDGKIRLSHKEFEEEGKFPEATGPPPGQDRDREKGAYHVNLVDEVTQWELVGCVEGISERFLAPLLETLIGQFPFKAVGFHSDNGSEYVNHVVAKLLNKLSIEQTKSRPRRSNDQALVEGKNGSVVRKHMGYVHIPGCFAERINDFYQAHFNAYVNYHRPSGYATTIVDAKGKERKKYELYEPPYEHFKKLPGAETYLRDGLTFKELDATAYAMGDNACATLMQEAKYQLFKSFRD